MVIFLSVFLGWDKCLTEITPIQKELFTVLFSRPVTQAEITIEGSYDFLHDMTCKKLSTKNMSIFRSANVKKFWLALQG